MDVFRKIRTWDGSMRAPTLTSGKGPPTSDEPEDSVYIDTTPHKPALYAYKRNTEGVLEWKHQQPETSTTGAR